LVPVFAILASLCWAGGWGMVSRRWQESRAGKIAIASAVLVLAFLLFNWGYELVRDADKLSRLFGPSGNQTWFPY
jgi:predicted small integral membrane protein